MPSKPKLKLDWCSHEAAKYAVEKWHYSQKMPAGKLVKVGVWENGSFIGAVIYGREANNNLGKPYGLDQVEICELVRVALSDHITPVSKIVSFSMKMLKRNNNGLRLIVSYADPMEGHAGGIYQAMNWYYAGKSQAQSEVMYNGKIMHKRTANALFGTIKGMEKSPVLWKHKYLYPLDRSMSSQIESLRQPYPKRASSIDVDASGVQPEEGGSNPTGALQFKKAV